LFSGGIDSSIVLSQAVKYHSNITAFTIGIEGSEDFEFAKRFCTDNSINHVVVPIQGKDINTKKILESITVSELTEYGDIINAVITIKVFKTIKAHDIKIVLTGDGSDELFAGYDMYALNLKMDEADALFQYKLKNLHRTELQRVDRCSMACGIEARVPFLDQKLINMAMSIPTHLKVKDNIEKWCLREAFKNELPEYILNRKKNPMSHSSGIHERIRFFKIRFKKYYNKNNYNLFEPIRQDFSYVLLKNKNNINASIKAAGAHKDYSKIYLMLESLKALRRYKLSERRM